MIIGVSQSTLKVLHSTRSKWYLIENYDDDDNNDDHDDNDIDNKDKYSCNSVNFKVRTSRFCMELDINHI